MSMADLEAAFAIIETNWGISHLAGPKPDSLIASAEAALGLKFPPTYKRFLGNLGCGVFDGVRIYGVLAADFEHSGIPDAIWLTLRNRTESPIPHSYVHIGDPGYGPYDVIDTAQVNADGESPIVEWWPGLSDAIDNGKILAPDFGAYLLELVRQALIDHDADLESK